MLYESVFASDSLDSLEQVTLGARIQADAVECSLDELRDVVLGLYDEDAAIQECEEQLRTLLQEQDRLGALEALLLRSRQQRQADVAVLEQFWLDCASTASASSRRGKDSTTRLSNPGSRSVSRSTTGLPRLTQKASAAGDRTPKSTTSSQKKSSAELLSDALASVKSLECSKQSMYKCLKDSQAKCCEEKAADGESISSLKEAIDLQVELLRQKLRSLELHSTRRRMKQLRLAKDAAAEASRVIPDVFQEVDSFQFSSTVESLWATSSDTKEECTHPPFTVEEVRHITRGALARMTHRYHVALNLLEDTLRARTEIEVAFESPGDAINGGSDHDRSEALKLRSCCAYANLLGGPSYPDTHFAEELEALLKMEKSEPSPSVLGSTSGADCDTTSIGKPLENSRVVEPLGLSDYICLPTTYFPRIAELGATPTHFYASMASNADLPHFTFSSTSELQALARLQVEIQRKMLKQWLDELDFSSTAELSLKAKNITEARLLLGGDEIKHQAPYNWTTLIKDA